MTAHEHFDELQAMWAGMFERMRAYLKAIDGDTSREIGAIVRDLSENRRDRPDWRATGTASFIHGDTMLWHEVANSRKK